MCRSIARQIDILIVLDTHIAIIKSLNYIPASLGKLTGCVYFPYMESTEVCLCKRLEIINKSTDNALLHTNLGTYHILSIWFPRQDRPWRTWVLSILTRVCVTPRQAVWLWSKWHYLEFFLFNCNSSFVYSAFYPSRLANYWNRKLLHGYWLKLY